VIQVDAHAPFNEGRLVVQRLVHGSAYVGLLGRARSHSLGTEGAEALPRWDPSTSCPRWLLNTTCGAPSSWVVAPAPPWVVAYRRPFLHVARPPGVDDVAGVTILGLPARVKDSLPDRRSALVGRLSRRATRVN
jgi:hypothetical protein